MIAYVNDIRKIVLKFTLEERNHVISNRKRREHIFDTFAIIFWRSQRNDLYRDTIFWS